MKALIAEDNTASRILLEKILKTQGHSVTSAENGEEALELYKKGAYDMVFLDWMMPGMNGIEVCREIKDYDTVSGRKSYVIMVTAKTKKEDVMTALEAGADDFISKPISSSVLASRISIGARMKHAVTTDALLVLEEEHKVLLRMSKILEEIAGKMEGLKMPPKILEWCKSTALLLDIKVHHSKEDQFILMFLERAIAEHGESPNSRIFSRTSLKTIEEEHDQLVALLEKMQSEIDAYASEQPEAAAHLKKTIIEYVILLREHKEREEKFLFPLSRKYFSDEDMGRLLARFSEIEEEVGLEALDKRTKQMMKFEEVLKIGTDKGGAA